MPFNEQNTVEHFIIHQLSGINLNAVEGNIVKEDDVEYDTVKWKYVQADLLQRDITEVFVEKELKEALCRLNPDIAAQPDKADEVIHKLRAILISVNNVGFSQLLVFLKHHATAESHTLPLLCVRADGFSSLAITNNS